MDSDTSATMALGGPEAATRQSAAADTDGLVDGYVNVVAPAEPSSIPELRPSQNERRPEARVVSPIPQALPEASFTSPHRRGTPTTPSSRRRQRHQVTYEDLASRPRSNQRQRTPMRYESPLEYSHFRRNEAEEPHEETTHEARRITIRPMAGRAPGVVAQAPERVSRCLLFQTLFGSLLCALSCPEWILNGSLLMYYLLLLCDN